MASPRSKSTKAAVVDALTASEADPFARLFLRGMALQALVRARAQGRDDFGVRFEDDKEIVTKAPHAELEVKQRLRKRTLDQTAIDEVVELANAIGDSAADSFKAAPKAA